MSKWKTMREMAKETGLTLSQVRQRLHEAGFVEKQVVTRDAYGNAHTSQWRPTRPAEVRGLSRKATQSGAKSQYKWFWPYFSELLKREEADGG